jgi:hypothetical protein
MTTSKERAGTRGGALVVAGLAALLMAPKCGTEVTVPSEDPTPPAVSLSILQGAKPLAAVPAGGATWTIARGDQVVVFAEGRDPQGLKRVTVTSSSEMICSAGTLDEERREDVVHTETNEVKPGGTGHTVLFTALSLDGRFECSPGLVPRSRRISVYGTAENYGGGVSTTAAAVIEVDLTRPAAAPPPK